MQVVFFLLPKSETVYLQDSFSARQALEKMQHHGLTALPILDSEGRYTGTITASDFLWYFKDKDDISMQTASKVPLMEIPRNHDNVPVSVNARIEDLFDAAMAQNFIPMIDDRGVFVGIVRRREILEYYKQQIVGKLVAERQE